MLILPRDIYLGYMEIKWSIVKVLFVKVENNKPVEYYPVACWELSDQGFVNKKCFLDYLNNLTIQFTAEVLVTVY